MVWDWGTYELEEVSAAESMRRGEVKFRLHGERLRGRYTLVRTRSQKDWLLIKKRDEAADPSFDINGFTTSVKTGRTREEIEQGKDAVWSSRREQGGGLIDLAEAEKGSMPATLEPMKASLVDEAFDDDRWLFEVKWDGIRLISFVRDGKASFQTRRGRPRVSGAETPAGSAYGQGGDPGRRGRGHGRAGAPVLSAASEPGQPGRKTPVRGLRRGLRRRPAPFQGSPRGSKAPAPGHAATLGIGPLLRARHRPGKGFLLGGSKQSAGGHRGQAAPESLPSRRAQQQLAEDQGGQTAGGRDRRLHGTAQQPQALRGATGGRLRRRQAGLHGPHRRRLRREDAGPGGPPARAAANQGIPLQWHASPDEREADLDQASAGGRGEVRGVDQGRRHAHAGLPGDARRRRSPVGLAGAGQGRGSQP